MLSSVSDSKNKVNISVKKESSTRKPITDRTIGDPTTLKPKNTKKPKKNKTSTKRKILRTAKVLFYILAFVSASILILFNYTITPAAALYAESMSGKRNLEISQEQIVKQNFTAALIAVNEAHDNFSRADESLESINFLRFIPVVNTQLSAGDKLLKSGIALTSSFSEILVSANSIMDPIKSETTENIESISEEDKAAILKNLWESSPSFERALSKIELAEEELANFPKVGVIPQIAEASNLITDQLPEIKELVFKAAEISKLLPGFAGYPNEQTYLFLFQNNTELRPSGGFLGSYGILKLKDGSISDFTTDDTYNLDLHADINETPPWQIVKLTNPDLDSWYLRDSNWSPDFPTSAKNVLYFYDIEDGHEKPDGVIAITPTFLEFLLELVGPTKVPGYNITFDSENFTDKLEYQVEVAYKEQGIPLENRKDIIGELGETLIAKVFSLPKEKWVDLFGTMEKSFAEKQALIYSNNEDFQKFLVTENWAGHVREANLDYAMIVDANMASLKTDKKMIKKIDYEIDLTKNQPEAKFNINYENTGTIDIFTTRYRSWSRLYVPKGSELISITGNETDPAFYNKPGETYEITEENGKTVFGTFVLIEPKTKKDLTFTYKLPSYFKDQIKKDNAYSLLLQKQPGIVSEETNIKVKNNLDVDSFFPLDIGTLSNDDTTEFQTELREDLEIQIDY